MESKIYQIFYKDFNLLLIGKNQIPDEGAIVISEALKVNRSLKSLNLSN